MAFRQTAWLDTHPASLRHWACFSDDNAFAFESRANAPGCLDFNTKLRPGCRTVDLHKAFRIAAARISSMSIIEFHYEINNAPI